MSKVDLDSFEICLKDGPVKISCTEFAEKYKTYTEKIKDSIIERLS